MKVETQTVTCGKCAHEWRAELLAEVPVHLFTAALKEVSCPNCGAGWRNVQFGRIPPTIPDPDTRVLSDIDRRGRWLALDDSGLSSRCIADKMCGAQRNVDHPHDGQDFGRCERLLALYPEWRARLPEMVTVSPYWAALVPRWAEIVTMWQEDSAAYAAGSTGPW
ncbi:MAG: hypothetical protein KGL39_58675, partial [Patescibacteria group bacterium]|nr:hypothetical protein [Patescibacteria group bacterium]